MRKDPFIWNRWLILILILFDLLILYSSYMIAFFFRFERNIPQYNFDPFVQVLPWIGLAALIIFYFFDLYSYSGRRSLHQNLYSIFLSIVLLTVVIIAVSFWVRSFAIPRSVIIIGSFIQLLLMIVFRSFLWYVLRSLAGKKKVLILSRSKTEANRALKKVLNHPRGWFEIYDYLTLGSADEIEGRLNQVDVVFITHEITHEEKMEILGLCMKYKKEMLVIPDLYELYMMGAEPQQVDDVLVISVSPPVLSSANLFMKRLTDIILSLFFLLLSSPIMIVLFILIPLTSKGSPIYKQVRLGKDEKPYVLYKFRSMKVDAEKGTGPVLARLDDSRITKIGKFIRRTRLDELPQLFNVLKGDMSLVGPRPERPFFIKQYKNRLPQYAYRMMVKPGLTGLAQIKAKYTTNPEDKLRYDLMYIRNYSIMLDLKIIFLTLIVMLQGEQAEGIMEEQPDLNQLENRKFHAKNSGVALGRKEL